MRQQEYNPLIQVACLQGHYSTSVNQVRIQDQQVRNGMLFIPDITGFTELVHSSDLLTGKQITCELLSTIIDQNQLGLKISEVEGDAVLFYRYGAAPGLVELMEQYRKMAKAFDNKRLELERHYARPLNLSLKVIAHYGPVSEYTIGHFTKLYGEVVVEAHRLLKNSLTTGSYLLLTDSLMESAGIADDNRPTEEGLPSHRRCELYGGLRSICFRYFDLARVKMNKQVA